MANPYELTQGQKAASLAGGGLTGGLAGAGIGTLIAPGVGTAIGGGIGLLAGLGAGALDIRGQGQQAEAIAEQQRMLQKELNKGDPNYQRLLRDVAQSESREVQDVSKSAGLAARRAGLDEAQTFALQQQAASGASEAGAAKLRQASMAVQEMENRRRARVLGEFTGAQQLAAMSPQQPSKVEALGQAAGLGMQAAGIMGGVTGDTQGLVQRGDSGTASVPSSARGSAPDFSLGTEGFDQRTLGMTPSDAFRARYGTVEAPRYTLGSGAAQVNQGLTQAAGAPAAGAPAAVSGRAAGAATAGSAGGGAGAISYPYRESTVPGMIAPPVADKVPVTPTAAMPATEGAVPVAVAAPEGAPAAPEAAVAGAGGPTGQPVEGAPEMAPEGAGIATDAPSVEALTDQPKVEVQTVDGDTQTVEEIQIVGTPADRATLDSLRGQPAEEAREVLAGAGYDQKTIDGMTDETAALTVQSMSEDPVKSTGAVDQLIESLMSDGFTSDERKTLRNALGPERYQELIDSGDIPPLPIGETKTGRKARRNRAGIAGESETYPRTEAGRKEFKGE